MMTPEQARKQWVKALRSGEYKQGTGFLEKDGKQCCLGVACREAIKDGVPLRVAENTSIANGSPYPCVLFDGELGSLPSAVKNWLGIKTVDIDGASAVARNDGDGQTFEQIADAIERGVT